jgi:hypothetical protein
MLAATHRRQQFPEQTMQTVHAGNELMGDLPKPDDKYVRLQACFSDLMQNPWQQMA